MCKVAGVTKITDQNRENVWNFMMALGDEMSKANNDGLGYAAFDSKGQIFGERWLINKSSFTNLERYFSKIRPENIKTLYSSFGNMKPYEAKSIILHTRMATCEKGIKNVHPFVNNIEAPRIAIIHNGIIHNHREFDKKYSTCDSEVIVHLYDKFSVNRYFNNMRLLSRKLSGWYTVLALSKDKDKRMIMDVFSDSRRLNSYYIKELDTRVYSTSEFDILTAAKVFGYTCEDLQTIQPDTAFRLDVLTGEVLNKLNLDVKITKNTAHVVYESGNLSDDEFVRRWSEYGFGVFGD